MSNCENLHSCIYQNLYVLETAYRPFWLLNTFPFKQSSPSSNKNLRPQYAILLVQSTQKSLRKAY